MIPGSNLYFINIFGRISRCIFVDALWVFKVRRGFEIHCSGWSNLKQIIVFHSICQRKSNGRSSGCIIRSRSGVNRAGSVFHHNGRSSGNNSRWGFVCYIRYFNGNVMRSGFLIRTQTRFTCACVSGSSNLNIINIVCIGITLVLIVRSIPESKCPSGGINRELGIVIIDSNSSLSRRSLQREGYRILRLCRNQQLRISKRGMIAHRCGSRT